jgi:glycosyltransferase involved in cell wall biosynthesis
MTALSVLMSVYSGEKPELFAMSLASIHDQSEQAAEVILVIDGPLGPELSKIIEKYKSVLPLKIYPLEINMGLAYALNHGLSYCNNEWVIRCDSDDYNVTDRFSSLAEMIANASENCAVVSSGVAEREVSSGKLFSVRTFESRVAKIGILLRDPVAHPATALNRKAVLSVGGYAGPLFFEDTYLWLRLLKSGYEFRNSKEILVHMSVNDDYFQRRRGLAYAMWELKAFLQFTSEKLVKPTSAPIVVLRLIFRLLPKRFVTTFYKNLLR